jgi:hypothetical protein
MQFGSLPNPMRFLGTCKKKLFAEVFFVLLFELSEWTKICSLVINLPQKEEHVFAAQVKSFLLPHYCSHGVNRSSLNNVSSDPLQWQVRI